MAGTGSPNLFQIRGAVADAQALRNLRTNKLKLKLSRESGGMADAQVSDACGSNTVWVQIPSLAPAFGLLECYLMM